MPIQTGDNKFGVAQWIVDPIPGLGTHTTITSALAAASSGEDIFIRPGTYTEDLTLIAGVNLVAFAGDENLPTVSIVGKLSYSGSGNVSINNIRLVTNGDFFLEVTGASASLLNIDNCFLECTDHTGINFTNSNASSSIRFFHTNGNIGTTGISLFSHSGAGFLSFIRGAFTNTGASTTQSTISSGTLEVDNCAFTFAISFTGTALGTLNRSSFSTGSLNITPITINIAGAINSDQCNFGGGTASALVITGGNFSTRNTLINSSNANAISGAGTLTTGIITFTGASSNIGVNTVVILPTFAVGSFFTFTPTAEGQTTAGTTTYTLQEGWGTITGRSVTVHFAVSFSAATGTGNLNIGNFPYTIANLSSNFAPQGSVNLSGGLTWPTSTTSIALFGRPNTTSCAIQACGNGASTGFYQIQNTPTGVQGTLTYIRA